MERIFGKILRALIILAALFSASLAPAEIPIPDKMKELCATKQLAFNKFYGKRNVPISPGPYAEASKLQTQRFLLSQSDVDSPDEKVDERACQQANLDKQLIDKGYADQFGFDCRHRLQNAEQEMNPPPHTGADKRAYKREGLSYIRCFLGDPSWQAPPANKTQGAQPSSTSTSVR